MKKLSLVLDKDFEIFLEIIWENCYDFDNVDTKIVEKAVEDFFRKAYKMGLVFETGDKFDFDFPRNKDENDDYEMDIRVTIFSSLPCFTGKMEILNVSLTVEIEDLNHGVY